MKKKMEFRVVSTRVFGTFKCFDDNEAAARRFMFGEICPDGRQIKPGMLSNDEHGPYRLEARPIGGTKDDWQEVQVAVTA